MRILFITSNRLGDAVLSTGLLDHLIRTYSDARITVACGPVAEGVFARMPNRDRTIVVDKLPFRLHWLPLWAGAVTTLWDLVVDIRGSTIAWMVPTRRRAVMRRRPGHKIAQLAAVLASIRRRCRLPGPQPRTVPAPPRCCRRGRRSSGLARPRIGRRRSGRPNASPRCSTPCGADPCRARYQRFSPVPVRRSRRWRLRCWRPCRMPWIWSAG